MIRHTYNFLVSLLLAMVSTACIRDEYPPCSALTVDIGIEDRNFSNISENPGVGIVGADASFADIISSLIVKLEDAETGETKETLCLEPGADDNQTCRAVFNDTLQYGKYVVTVWGNADVDFMQDKTDNIYRFEKQNRDVFVCMDTVEYQPGSQIPVINLRRAVGMLLTEVKGLPSYVTDVRVSVSGLSLDVDRNLRYSGKTEWTERFPSGTAGGGSDMALLPMLISPSVRQTESEVVCRFYSGENLFLVVPDVKVTVERNRITPIRYEWNEDNTVMVFAFIDGQWEKITGLDVDEQ